MAERTSSGTIDDLRIAIATSTGGRRVVEARFYLSGIERYQLWRGEDDQGPPIGISAKFTAAKHGTFGKATPSGEMRLGVANPDAAELLDRMHLEGLLQRRQSPSFRVWIVEELPGDEE